MKPNLRIEFCTQKGCEKSLYRYVYWRVVPSELGLIRRLLFNPWRKIYLYESNGTSSDLFSPSEFGALRKVCRTTRDIMERDERFSKLQEDLWENN
jgi:hypothetical protein